MMVSFNCQQNLESPKRNLSKGWLSGEEHPPPEDEFPLPTQRLAAIQFQKTPMGTSCLWYTDFHAGNPTK